MSGMSGGSMLRTRRKDANIKPNRRLDRKSSRGMLYENEDLRLRTININAEVERGQSDIKKLKRENEQLRREVGALRGEYDRLERLLHQRRDQDSPDGLEDDKTSGSCCSSCGSDCCAEQNCANAAWDLPGGPCCGGRGGPLSSVPEEPQSPRGPPDFTQGFPACKCQTTPSALKPSNTGFSTSESPVREFFTAVVTVPLASHLITTSPAVSLAPASVFPKSGLDILMNNNTFENFEGFTIAPPIGFVIPPPPSHEPNDEEPFQIVPNVEFAGEPVNIVCDAKRTDEDTPSDSFDCSDIGFTYPRQMIPFVQNNFCGFQNGGNIEDLLGDLDSVSSDSDFVKDSFFVCKTRKVIQQSTTVQNNSVSNPGANPCGCVCTCNQTEIAPASDVVVIDSNSDGSQFYRTEKSIELNYDYPKAVFNGVSPTNKLEDDNSRVQDGLTQTMHTTTEVNSTLMMFERKKIPIKGRNKFPIFGRSHSAPVETSTEEPVYATVKKLPKKLKRLHIRNLENEIRYIPPPEPKEEGSKDEGQGKSVEAAVEESILESPETDDEEVIVPKMNGTAHKPSVKSESASESSEKGSPNQKNAIPKSPLVRKKKRFSIHFKRKPSKNRASIKEEAVQQHTAEEPPVTLSDKVEMEIKSSESDKLLEVSSSPDTPDTVKFREHPPAFCKRHGKPKHAYDSHHGHHSHSQTPGLAQHVGPKHHHSEDSYPHPSCLLHKRSSVRSNDLGVKKGFHPPKGYFKHDSYQEMTTSHSERERTNSLSSSGHSGFSLGSGKPRSMSTSRREGNIPWCGCWGNSCV